MAIHRLTRADICEWKAPRYPITEANLALADEALDHLWVERCEERGFGVPEDRTRSCKFAALFAREVFGGRLAGNRDHVFVIQASGEILDLNEKQGDVAWLGEDAYSRADTVLLHPEYREALASCMPRVNRWVDWFIANLALTPAGETEEPKPLRAMRP